MIRPITATLFVLFCWPCAAQQTIVTVREEPANLSSIKQQLIAYHDCGEPNCYTPQIEHQADLAIQFMKKRVAAKTAEDKLALVLDIDETSLSNWSTELKDDFGYILADSDDCIHLRCGKAIPGTLRIFQEAEKDNVAVFFITGRPEGQRTDTEANLKSEGYGHWQNVYLRSGSHPSDESASQYKSVSRADIVRQGYKIIVNVGDQMSDLVDHPRAEFSLKLPNPFYFIP